MVHGKKTRYYLARILFSQRDPAKLKARSTRGNLENVPSHRVAIFRKRLLSYSETFIADQGQFLPSYKPVYCGYETDDSGKEMISGSDRVLLQQQSLLPGISKLLLRNGFNGGEQWLTKIASFEPELIHAHFFNDGVDAVHMARRLGLPLITTVHGHDLTKHGNAGAQIRLRENFFAQVDCIVAVSKFMANQALQRGCPEHKIRQHYIGIDLKKFSREKAESENPSVLFVGRLVEKKGCTYLLQALETLRDRFPDLQLTVVGEGSLRHVLQQEADNRGIRVEFTGSEPAASIRDRLAKSWLFAAPSITAGSGDTEGLGMVFLEAQALQTPVVSFRSGGVVEAVEDGLSGLLSDEKDVASLADNIASLLENSSLRHNMGAEGRKRVDQYFDVRKQCAELERIYDGLC